MVRTMKKIFFITFILLSLLVVLIILGFHRGLIQRPNIGIQQEAQAGDEARCEAGSLISTQSERIEWSYGSEARKGRFIFIR